MSRGWFAVLLAGWVCGCRVPARVRTRSRRSAPSRPAATAREHWNRAKTLAQAGRCGAAVFHLALALKTSRGAKPAWNEVPALVSCVEELSPPAEPKSRRRQGFRGAVPSLWKSRLAVSGGPVLVGMDPRSRAAWRAWGGAAPLPLGDERALSVRVAPFRMGACEVTVGQWNACVVAGACQGEKDGDPLLPVRGVRPAEAAAYCRWQGGRLPTRAEWVRAARGGSATPALYPWGDWWSGDCARVGAGSGPAPVGTHPCDVSPFGVADLGGNVAEFVQEERRPGTRILILGASWADSGRWALVAAARPLPRSLDQVGFRCVWDAR